MRYSLKRALFMLALIAGCNSSAPSSTLPPLPEAVGSFAATVDPLAGQVSLSPMPAGTAGGAATAPGSKRFDLTATLPDGSQVELRLWAQVISLDDGSALLDVVIENLGAALTVPGLALVIENLDAGRTLENADARKAGRPALHVGALAPRGLAFASARIGGAGTEVFSLNISLTVSEERPDAECEAGENSVEVGGTLAFGGQGSAASSGGSLEYSWTLLSAPEGSAAALSDPSAAATQLVTDAAGTYRVGLRVKEGEAESRTAVCTGQADPNPAPRARIDAPASVVLGERVVVDGSGSFDPLGDPLTYAWDFVHQPEGRGPGELGGAEFEDPQAAVTAFTAMAKGIYVVRLTVSDGVHEVRHAVVIRSGLDPRCACGLPIERVSVSSEGVQGNNVSFLGSGSGAIGSFLEGHPISADGCVVAYMSLSNNLVAGDTNNFDFSTVPPSWGTDVFVRDRKLGVTERVNVSADGEQATGNTLAPSVSADGRFVTFSSSATNLVPDDTNYYIDPDTGGLIQGRDIFVKDRFTGNIERASVRSDGQESLTGESGLNGISANSRFVVFVSSAYDLVNNDANAGYLDVFLHDRLTGTTSCPSCPSGISPPFPGSFVELNSISADGRYIVFTSGAADLAGGDNNGTLDVFLYDSFSNTLTRVTKGTSGEDTNGKSRSSIISQDGRFIVFASEATNLTADGTNSGQDVFLYDRLTSNLERLPQDITGEPDAKIWVTDISTDGRYLVLGRVIPNGATSIWDLEMDVFVYNRLTTTTALVSASASGDPGDLASGDGTISSDGRYIMFNSYATNLVPGDTNGVLDIFVAPNPLYDCEAQ